MVKNRDQLPDEGERNRPCGGVVRVKISKGKCGSQSASIGLSITVFRQTHCNDRPQHTNGV